jgi:hypothetical protein
VSSDELDQFGADVSGDVDLVEIGRDPGGCEFCRMSPSHCRPGQRAVGIEDCHAQRPVVARVAVALSQKIGQSRRFLERSA